MAIGYAAIDPTASVALIITDHPDDADFDFGVILPANVFVFNARAVRTATPEDVIEFLTTLLYLSPPDVFHVINSQAAFRYLQQAAAEGPKHFEVATSVFCFDKDSSGRHVGYIHDYVIPLLNTFDRIYSDNTAIIEAISNRYALSEAERSLFRVVYNPVLRDVPRRAPVICRPSRFPRVLWVGRLDRQKRVDTLFEIARRERGM